MDSACCDNISESPSQEAVFFSRFLMLFFCILALLVLVTLSFLLLTSLSLPNNELVSFSQTDLFARSCRVYKQLFIHFI